MEIRRLGKQSKKVGPDGRDGVRFTRTRSKETRDESEHANFLVRMKQMRILENSGRSNSSSSNNNSSTCSAALDDERNDKRKNISCDIRVNHVRNLRNPNPNAPTDTNVPNPYRMISFTFISRCVRMD